MWVLVVGDVVEHRHQDERDQLVQVVPAGVLRSSSCA
jgi:hypothetical protein